MTLLGKSTSNRKRLCKTCFQAKSKKNVWFNIISNWILTNPVVFISFLHVHSCIFDSVHGFVHMPFFTKFVWHYWVRTFDRVISWFLPVCYPPCYCLEANKNCSLDFDFDLELNFQVWDIYQWTWKSKDQLGLAQPAFYNVCRYATFDLTRVISSKYLYLKALVRDGSRRSKPLPRSSSDEVVTFDLGRVDRFGWSRL